MEPPEDSWGAAGGCLRPSWGLPGPLGGVLGASWDRRGATWKPREGLQEPPKIASRLHFVLVCGKNHRKGVQKSTSETLGGLSRFLFHFFPCFQKSGTKCRREATFSGSAQNFRVQVSNGGQIWGGRGHPGGDFFRILSAKCQTVAKIEGVTRGSGVDFWTPLRCFLKKSHGAYTRGQFLSARESETTGTRRRQVRSS